MALTLAGFTGTASVAVAGTQQGQLDPGDTVYPGQSVVSPVVLRDAGDPYGVDVVIDGLLQ